MNRFDRVKELVKRVYSATIRAESLYAFTIRQYRESVLRKECEQDPKLLTPYGWSGYSQNDEDGIIREIFRRIGTANRQFFEFGSGAPLTNAGTYLLLSGWRGEWADANAGAVADIREQFRPWIEAGYLAVNETFITPENINSLMAHLPKDVDLLVVDIDGNDYHVWKAMEARPRVVMIEYNAVFRPPDAVVQPYLRELFWDGKNFSGASLKALEYLGREKGYSLVGCNFPGSNAFFVRNDLIGDNFSSPYSAEHHYREQWIDAMMPGPTRMARSAGPGIRYEIIESDDAVKAVDAK